MYIRTCFLNKSACTASPGSVASINCITSSIVHSLVGVLATAETGDSIMGAGSAGVVDVAASSSAGGFRFAGGDLVAFGCGCCKLLLILFCTGEFVVVFALFCCGGDSQLGQMSPCDSKLKRLLQHSREAVSSGNVIVRSLDLLMTGSFMLYVVPWWLIAISSPRKLPRRASIVSALLLDATNMNCINFLITPVGVVSSHDTGS